MSISFAACKCLDKLDTRHDLTIEIFVSHRFLEQLTMHTNKDENFNLELKQTETIQILADTKMKNLMIELD